MVITVQPNELVEGKLSKTHVKQAVKAIRVEGYVVIENIINHEHLDILRERMDADSQELIKAKKWGGAGVLKGHLQQGPPPLASYIFSDIVANPYVIQVSKEMLGPGVYNNFYNGNTNCPGSSTQPLHRDGDHLWQNLEVAHPAAEVVVNISPQDTIEENGSVGTVARGHIWMLADDTLMKHMRLNDAKLRHLYEGMRKKGARLSEICGSGTEVYQTCLTRRAT